MTLKDLRNGDFLVLRNEGIYVYMEDKNNSYPHDLIKLEGGYMSTKSYTPNLKHKDTLDNQWDIVKIYRPFYVQYILENIAKGKKLPSDCTLIYTAKEEVKEMTIAEISKALGYEVKIVKEEER